MPAVSRQRRWQRKQVAAGMCKICGKPRGKCRQFCDPCNEKIKKHRRAKRRKDKAAQ